MEHSLVLKSDSTVWSMGRNNEGQLGVGNYIQSWTPVQVNLPVATKEISAGLFHNMAVGSDNTLRMWGNNFDGTVGIGTSQNYVPTPTATLSVCSLASGLSSEAMEVNILVYPNPACEAVQIWCASEGVAEIFDLNGREVFSGHVASEKTALDVSGWDQGLYFLRLKTAIGVSMQRLMIYR